jgi:hypothetical protein
MIAITTNIALTRTTRRDPSAIIPFSVPRVRRPVEWPGRSLVFRDRRVAAVVQQDCVMDLITPRFGEFSPE